MLLGNTAAAYSLFLVALVISVSGQSCNNGQRVGPADGAPQPVTAPSAPTTCSQPATAIGRLDSGQDACCCTNPEGQPCQTFGRKLQQFGFGGGSSANQWMLYPYGSPVLTGAVNVHLIWYGTWSPSDPAIALVELFVANLGCSDYWAVVGQYYSQQSAGAPKTYISGGSLTLGGSTFVSGGGYANDSCGGDGLILTHSIITSSIASGALGSVSYANDIFLVLPSADIAMPANFPTSWCSYHYYWSDPVAPLHMGIIGNPLNNPKCAYTSNTATPTPNGNFEADTIVNLIVHELAEFVSDPMDNGWETTTGVQISNACSWQFGTVVTMPSGAHFNTLVGGNFWLVQEVWDNWSPTTGCVNGALKPLKSVQVELQLLAAQFALGKAQLARPYNASAVTAAQQSVQYLQEQQAVERYMPWQVVPN